MITSRAKQSRPSGLAGFADLAVPGHAEFAVPGHAEYSVLAKLAGFGCVGLVQSHQWAIQLGDV
eukprot:1357266-Amorphochlora_amoeboformis.AAC.1